MTNNEITRAKEFASKMGLSISSFERKTGIGNGYFANRERTKKTDIPVKYRSMIYAAFPTLSPEWLENGEGEMLRPLPSSHNTLIGSNNVNNNLTNSSTTELLAVIEREQQMNLKLIQQYERLLSLYEELAKKNQ